MCCSTFKRQLKERLRKVWSSEQFWSKWNFCLESCKQMSWNAENPLISFQPRQSQTHQVLLWSKPELNWCCSAPLTRLPARSHLTDVVCSAPGPPAVLKTGWSCHPVCKEYFWKRTMERMVRFLLKNNPSDAIKNPCKYQPQLTDDTYYAQ